MHASSSPAKSITCDRPMRPGAACHACDAMGWCWGAQQPAQSVSCGRCDQIDWCQPGMIETAERRCSECDHAMLCAGKEALTGRCPHDPAHCQRSGCPNA